ncbi:TRZ/ATZ family hydrolase [Kushneria phosphatilytica]|uniref:TRZ/ATZ family hydrolase n=2 Tax=Kushneria phosphatilytica TaxID=657387 RepID=A0A1S1NVF3_9GAMM|nr:TRZ/ATZ family hydrolase [Kushneria phosphatilytica]OHV11941.1 N-ethylammeline chlorohydrolase [Kushneria phosphatilytica]QEL12792.1 TRZ/ATZ family hydrolase [Kushneria phosphatilytica]
MSASYSVSADLLIECRWLLPMTDDLPVKEWQAIALHDGIIVGIWPIEEARIRVHAQQTLRLTQHALMPGLVNAHNHAGMTMMRGYADDLPLMTWLNDHIWPAEAAFMQPEFVADGTRLAIAEMLRSGTTLFSDMYLSPETAAELVASSGIRAQICTPLIDFATPWARDFASGIELSEALLARYRGHDRISIALGPHAPYTVGDESLEQLCQARDRLNVPIQMHVHETRDEVDTAGIRPLQRLHAAGLLDNRFQAVHMTQLTDEEIQMVADSGASVIHCPQSNLKLASGFCPVARLLDAGIPVALGTDGACSNNDLNLFDEMRQAALLAKGFSGDAAVLPAMAALAMATIEGARALGVSDRTGCLQTGMAADIIAVNLDSLETQPVHHPESALVYAVNSRQVSHVWVAGQLLLENGVLVNEDEDELLQLARHRQRQMADAAPHYSS